MDFNEIENHVIKNGFARHYNRAIPGAEYGTDDISEGILYASKDPEFVKDTSEAARRFYAGDWGTMLKRDAPSMPGMYDVNIPGSEFGEYPSKFGEIYIHREDARTVMFFMFER